MNAPIFKLKVSISADFSKIKTMINNPWFGEKTEKEKKKEELFQFIKKKRERERETRGRVAVRMVVVQELR